MKAAAAGRLGHSPSAATGHFHLIGQRRTQTSQASKGWGEADPASWWGDWPGGTAMGHAYPNRRNVWPPFSIYCRHKFDSGSFLQFLNFVQPSPSPYQVQSRQASVLGTRAQVRLRSVPRKLTEKLGVTERSISGAGSQLSPTATRAPRNAFGGAGAEQDAPGEDVTVLDRSVDLGPR